METTLNDLIKGLQDEVKLVKEMAKVQKEHHETRWNKLLDCFNDLAGQLIKLTEQLQKREAKAKEQEATR